MRGYPAQQQPPMWLQDNQACRSRPELFMEQEKMLGYATVGARDLEAAKQFYDGRRQLTWPVDDNYLGRLDL